MDHLSSSGFAAFGAAQGVYVLDTRTNLLLADPIPTAERVHDVVISR